MRCVAVFVFAALAGLAPASAQDYAPGPGRAEGIVRDTNRNMSQDLQSQQQNFQQQQQYNRQQMQIQRQEYNQLQQQQRLNQRVPIR